MVDEDGEEEPNGCKRKRGLQDDGWHILDEALTSLSDHHTCAVQMEVKQLILAKAKEKHEVAKEQHQIALYERQLAMDTARDRADAWVKYEKWAESTNPLLRAKAERLGQELAALEGIHVS